MKINIPERQQLVPGGNRARAQDPREAGALYGEVAQFGREMGALNAELAERKAHATRAALVSERVSQARVDHATWLEERAKTPDAHESVLTDAARYQRDLNTSLTKDLDARTRHEVSLHLQPFFAQETIKARHLQTRQAVDIAAAKLDKSLDDLTLSASRAESADEMREIIDFGAASIEAQRQAGTLSAEQAGKRSDNFRNQIYSNQIERDLLEAPEEVFALLSKPENYADLRPDLRTRYLARAQAMIEGKKRERLTLLRERVKDADYALDRGYVPPDLEEIAQQVKGTELERTFTLSVESARNVAAYALERPQVQDEFIARAKANRSRSGEQVRLIERLDQVRERQRKDLKDDPLQLGVELGFEASPDPLNFEDREQMIAGLKQRGAMANRLEGHFGQPISPLFAREVEMLAKGLKSASAQEKLRAFDTIHEGLGERAKLAFAKLAPDDPVTALAGFNAKVDPKASELMLRGQDILRPDRKSDGSPSGGALITMPSEKEMTFEFYRLTRDAFVGMADSVRSTIYQGARAIYAARSMDSGDKDTSKFDDDRFAEAVTMAVGPIEKHNGRMTILPRGYDRGQFKTEVRKRIESMAERGELPANYTASHVADLPLQPYGDRRYVIVSGSSLLADSTGKKPLEIDLTQELPKRQTAPLPMPPAKTMRLGL